MQCKQLVNDYLPQILQAIMDMPLDQICGSIGLCSAHKEVEQRRMMLVSQAVAATTRARGASGRQFIRPARSSSSSSSSLRTSRTDAADFKLPGWDELAARASKKSGDSAVGGSAVCDFCQTAVQYIKIALDSNETVAQVHGRGSVGEGFGMFQIPFMLQVTYTIKWGLIYDRFVVMQRSALS